MKMQAYTFVNNETGECITLYAKISDARGDTMYNVLKCKGKNLGVFDDGWVDVKE